MVAIIEWIKEFQPINTELGYMVELDGALDKMWNTIELISRGFPNQGPIRLVIVASTKVMIMNLQ